MTDSTGNILTDEPTTFEDVIESNTLDGEVPDFTKTLGKFDPQTAAMVYGIVAAVLAATPALLYSFWLRKTEYYSSVGYKFAAYSHLFLWSTVFIGWVFAIIFRSLSMLKVFKSFAWGSIAGPWFFNIISAVYMFGWGTQDGVAGQWIGAITFSIYTAASMFYQIMFLPDATKWEKAFAEQMAEKLQEDVNNSDAAGKALLPDFNDLDYLDIDGDNKSYFDS